jgi:HK97 family phage prohead protease
MRLQAELPENYRPATDQDVPEGQACGNCAFFNEEDVAPDGRARCTQWDEYVEGGYYCNSWQARAEASKDEDEDEDEDTYMAPNQPTITLSFSADVTAADVDRRTIVGRILPFGEIGNTSLGPVVFEQGSIVSPGEVKLLLEHDGRRPIGKSTAFVSAGDHITGSFKISNTTAGTDALIEAADGLRNGLSVGANILEHTVSKNGVMTVTSAELVEVSLVTSPAFAGAQVTQVAASTQPEGQKMEEQTVEVAATEAAPSTPQPVEAATPMVASATPSVPYATAQPRDLKNLTAGGMLRAQLRASFGDHDAQMLVKAALGEQTTVRDGGVIPVPLLREIIGVVDDTRYFINSIDRQALPDAGMSFRIPKITTLPNVAEQTTELDEVASVQSQIEDITVNVKTFAGGNKVSRQLIERSDPAYFDELLRQLAARYAQATDVFAYTQAIIGAGDSDGETIYDSIAVGIADSYSVMRFTPNRLLVAPTSTGAFDYKDLLSEVDQGGRPLFAAALPQNAAGLVTQGSTQGTVAGLQLVVNPNLQGLNINPRVYPSAFATFYETAGSPVRVELRHADDLSVDVSLYGYVALANKYPTALRNLTVTPPSTS